MSLIRKIALKEYAEAEELVLDQINEIVLYKLSEMKKAVAAKIGNDSDSMGDGRDLDEGIKDR